MNSYPDSYILQRTGNLGGTIVKREDYYCQSGGSDKVYIGVIIESPNKLGYYFYCLYGARGNELQVMNYNQETYLKKIAERSKKGYQRCNLRTSIAVGTMATAPGSTVLVPAEQSRPSWPRVIWPQGAAATPKDEVKLQEIIDSEDYIYEYKYRGVRATIHIPPKGSTEPVRIFGRNPVQDDPTRPHEFTDKLPHIRDLKFPEQFADTVLDGELLSKKYGISVGSDAKIAGDLSAEDGRDNSHIYFVAFDLLVAGGSELFSKPWEERRALLEIVCTSLVSAGIDIKASWYTDKDIAEAHNKILASGGEGGIFKNKKATYVQGKKPANNWIKWKRVEMEDVVIMGYTIAEPGKYNNGADIILIGAIEYGMYTECDQAEFDQAITSMPMVGTAPKYIIANNKPHKLTYIGKCSGMSDKARREFTDNGDKYLGKVMKIFCHDKSKDGTHNLARFGGLHEDKAPYFCIYDGKVKAKRAPARKRKTANAADNSKTEATA